MPKTPDEVGGRARQVLDVIYRLGEATVADIHDELPDIPSYSAVRSTLRALEAKELIQHEEKGMRYVYSPTMSKGKRSRSAVAHVLETFFDGSPHHAMKALLDVSRDGGYDIDFSELERLIADAQSEGR